MKRLILLLSILLIQVTLLSAQGIIPLYLDVIKGGRGTLSKTDEPTLTVYTPEKGKANGIGILVIPGGAYSGLATATEGTPIALAFAKHGITAFVLKYRLPSDQTMVDKTKGSLQDAVQALNIIKSTASQYNIDTTKLGVIGFSAGGHLAGMLATTATQKPKFAILMYPVISMKDAIAHQGSKAALIGTNADPEIVNAFSVEVQVSKLTPPVYLTHAEDDSIVKVDNSLVMYDALRRSMVSAELHLYPKGGHGFIQRLPDYEWLVPILIFLRHNGFYDGDVPGRNANDPAVLTKELNALKKAGKKDEAYVAAQKFINSLKSSEVWKIDNLKFITEFTNSSKQRGFAILLKNRAKIDTIIDKKSPLASYRIKAIAIKEDIEPLLKNAMNSIDWKSFASTIQKKYGTLGMEALNGSLMAEAMEKKNISAFDKYFIAYSNTALSRPDFSLNTLGMFVFKNCIDKNVINAAIRIMEYDLKHYTVPGTAAASWFWANHVDTYANLLYKAGRKEEAIKWQEKAVAQTVNPNIIANLEKMKKGEKTW